MIFGIYDFGVTSSISHGCFNSHWGTHALYEKRLLVSYITILTINTGS